MKIIFIIIIIIIILYLIKKREKKRNFFIKFLNITESHKIYNNYDAINYYKTNELKYRSKNKTSNRNKMIELYKKNCMLFTKKEKSNIIENIKKIYNKFEDSNFPLINKWKFIKVSSNFDFGYPYTINDVIIIPSNYTNSNLEKTLFHEQFHILQYKNQIKFEIFYKNYWNFKKISLPENNCWLNEHIITNPDGYKKFYYIKIKENRILPILVLIKNKMENIGIFLNKKNEIKNNKIIYKKLKNIDNYYNKFYKINQNYHPNEIFANLMVKCGYNNLKMDKKIINFLNILQK